MQMKSAFRVAPLPDLKAVLAGALARAKAAGVAAVQPFKALGSRVSAVVAKPWFFPVQAAIFLAVLWLQQHGYLQIPITVCDWASFGK